MVTSTPNLFGSPTIPFFLFYFTITALVEITSDLLGDKFPSQLSILISQELATAAFDVVDNLSSLKPLLCF